MASERKLLQAKDDLSTTVDGVAVTLRKGDVVDDADPVLKGRADLFEPFEPRVREYPGQRRTIEQATRAPGERRQR